MLHFVYPSVDQHLGRVHLLVIVNKAAMNWVYKYLFKSLLLIPMVIYPGVELLYYVIILCFIFGEPLHCLFLGAPAPLDVPTSSAQKFQFLHILANI